MRKVNESILDSGIYTCLRAVKMCESDRNNAVAALLRAEEIANGILWLKQKLADAGHAFLKPSLRL